VATFGQEVLDGLRRRDWWTAVAREASRFEIDCLHRGIEDRAGAIGAAAGAANVAYGLAALTHDVLEKRAAEASAFLAWSISADGKRGVASCEVAG
jgi:hypothetical protein